MWLGIERIMTMSRGGITTSSLAMDDFCTFNRDGNEDDDGIDADEDNNFASMTSSFVYPI